MSTVRDRLTSVWCCSVPPECLPTSSLCLRTSSVLHTPQQFDCRRKNPSLFLSSTIRETTGGSINPFATRPRRYESSTKAIWTQASPPRCGFFKPRLHIQPVVKPVVKPVVQPGLTTGCMCKRGFRFTITRFIRFHLVFLLHFLYVVCEPHAY